MKARRLLALTSALVSSSLALATGLDNYDAYLSSPATSPPAFRLSESSDLPPAIVSSLEEQRSVPAFLWASPDQELAPIVARGTPEQAARWYLRQHAPRYGLSEGALRTLHLIHVHDTGRGGVIAVFRQRVDGIELYRSETRVLLTRALGLVAISGSPHPAALPVKAEGRLSFRQAPGQAIAAAVEDLYGVPLAASSLLDTDRVKAGWRYFTLKTGSALEADGRLFSRPARVRKVFYPMPDRIVPAWHLELFIGEADRTTSDTYTYVMAADDGRLLHRRDLTHDAAFSYRAWAESGALVPYAGPQEDYAPHPTGHPDGTQPAFVPPGLVTIDGFNTNPQGGVDPWLEAGATTTTGNNVDAYADHSEPDGFSDGDIRPTATGPETFDRVYDVTQEALASPEQSMAAVTQLFYTTNWLHDWWYDSGFNEGAGVAQLSNFGRGGAEGDPLHAEGQDAALEGALNNANMSTPDDGESPRMQMYLWAGQYANVTVPQLGELEAGTAAFGPDLFELTGNVVLANDQTDTPTDGCTQIRNNVRGRIALIDRGNCDFQKKALNAEAAGAVGVLIANNVEGPPPGMAEAKGFLPVGIPTLSITQEDGNSVKALLGNGAVSATLKRATGFTRDGTIDNTIVAHEWGHYLHNRQLECSTQQCRSQGEGWADFVAMHMIHHEGDDLDGTYAIAIYATNIFGDSGYYGIRRVPYSVDFTKNALTFQHIQASATMPTDTTDMLTFAEPNEIHNAGEIWGSMMWEAYAALLQETEGAGATRTYDEARRQMSDYVVAGLMLAPDNPTFTEQRDALLAAAYANDEADFITIADAFARRGAGSCAVSPARDSVDLEGVVESYQASGRVQLGGIELDDSIASCDHDGHLDAGETGRLTLEVLNAGVRPLTAARATLRSSMPGVRFPKGATVDIDPLDPFASTTVEVEVALDGSVQGIVDLPIEIELDDPSSCNSDGRTVLFRANYDDKLAASSTETVESEQVVWTMTNAAGEGGVWAREATIEGSNNHVFHGTDVPFLADGRLDSPPLKVLGSGNLVITFSHRHEFETAPLVEGGADIYWDGGVIEISNNNGSSWQDISRYVDPGYNGTIGDRGSNPLADRPGFVDTNPSWPEMDTVTLNLGTAFAGKTVLLRFRLGTDEAAGAYGWEIDDITVQNLTNKPFPAIVEDASSGEVGYEDADGDGHGAGDAVELCGLTEGYASVGDDCDDGDALTYPGSTAPENEVDRDCDGTVEPEETPVPGDDDDTTGDDDDTTGDDDDTTGDDDDTTGDDDDSTGDDDDTTGDDDDSTGDDDDATGDDDDATGDDDDSTGDDDDSTGDDDDATGDDDDATSPPGDDTDGCSCSAPGSSTPNPGLLPLFLMAGALLRRRARGR